MNDAETPEGTRGTASADTPINLPPEPEPAGQRVLTVGVRFSTTGRTVLCDPGSLYLREGELVTVDDRRGGAVVKVSLPTALRRADGGLPRVLRRANDDDRLRLDNDHKRSVDALAFARERARARGLHIKLFRAEFGPRGERATFTYASEHRIDFRELVRDLAARFHARIEMRQVSVREEAKMVGGIGSCGLELCCTTFLREFQPVSIRMAKHQNIALNPVKVSGQCGRLKCCLVYEDATYVELGKGLPKLGKQVETPEGLGRVQDLDILRGRVRVFFPDKPPQVFEAKDVRRLIPPQGQGGTRDKDEDHDEPAAGLPPSDEPSQG